MLRWKHAWALMYLLILVVASSLSCAHGQDVAPMARNIVPSFDVATIRPTDPADQSAGFHTQGHRIYIENETFDTLVMFAYSVHKSQIVGGPDWIGSDRFDIKGVPDAEGEPNLKQQQAMLRKLLTERFGFTFQREPRTLPIYALTVAKTGPKLTRSQGDPDGLPDQTGNGGRALQDWRFTNNSMDEFAQFLQHPLERPVVNQTGLAGKFDFLLKWTPNDLPATESAAPPGLFTALREQLGLNIEARKSPVEVLVVTHVERPTAN